MTVSVRGVLPTILCAAIFLSQRRINAQPQLSFSQISTNADYWAHRTSLILQERSGAASAWTGSELLVWGGNGVTNGTQGFPDYGVKSISFSDGARYNPANDSWTQMSSVNVPPPFGEILSTWTGRRFLVLGTVTGGTRGGSYDPVNDEWSMMAQGPSLVSLAGCVWTGKEFIVCGGTSPASSSPLSFSRFDPDSGSWRALSPLGAPAGSQPLGPPKPAMVWTGSEMIIMASSARHAYNPVTDSWRVLSSENAPFVQASSSFSPSAVWTGTEFLFWQNGQLSRYDPSTDTWKTGASSPTRALGDCSAIWTGQEMILFGGSPGDTPLFFSSAGARYNPQSDSWTRIGLPFGYGRAAHCAVWTGQEMLICVGTNGHDFSGSPAPIGFLRDLWAHNPASEALPLVLRWTTSISGFNLEKSTNLSDTNWAIMNLNDLNSTGSGSNAVVKIPPPKQSEFYRLRKP